MAQNTSPIYGLIPDPKPAGAVIGSSANTATDGTGANMFKIYDADATNGSFIQLVRLKPISTIAATVARLWLCTDTGTFTAGTTNTAVNTTLIGEISISAWTASNTVASPNYELPVNFPIGAGYKLLMSFGTSTGAGTTGFNPLTVAIDY
jgi:hypothetical protein